MIRYARSHRAFAVGLAVLAGYVDATGFIALGGFFVSFMSGNSTRLGVGLARGSAEATVAGGLIACFVAGVFCGTIAGRLAESRGDRRRPAVILLMVSGLLAIGCGLAVIGLRPAALALAAMAMGAENTIFEREGEVSVGVTYMTGALVKLGQRAAGALFGEARLGWLPYLLLWLGLVCGAVAGAACYSHLGLQALWLAVAAGLGLALVSVRLGPLSA